MSFAGASASSRYLAATSRYASPTTFVSGLWQVMQMCFVARFNSSFRSTGRNRAATNSQPSAVRTTKPKTACAVAGTSRPPAAFPTRKVACTPSADLTRTRPVPSILPVPRFRLLN